MERVNVRPSDGVRERPAVIRHIRCAAGPFDCLSIPTVPGFTGRMPKKTHRTKRPTVHGAPETAHTALVERTLDLVALVGLLAVVTAVFLLAGPEAFAVVTSVGTGLFAAWRGRRQQT